MSEAKDFEVFTPKNRLAEKAVERDAPVEELISRAEAAVSELGVEIGPELDPEIQALRERLLSLTEQEFKDSGVVQEFARDARRLGEVADTLGFLDVGQILSSLQELLSGSTDTALDPDFCELARLHIAALQHLSGVDGIEVPGDGTPHTVTGELEAATRKLTSRSRSLN